MVIVCAHHNTMTHGRTYVCARANHMDFDLIEKPNEKKKMVWSFKIDYNEAKTYRKEREGMLRPNQWEDLIVRVYI